MPARLLKDFEFFYGVFFSFLSVSLALFSLSFRKGRQPGRLASSS